MELYGNLLYAETPSLRISENNPEYQVQTVNVIKNETDLNNVISYITELQTIIENEEQKIAEYFQYKRNKSLNLQ